MARTWGEAREGASVFLILFLIGGSDYWRVKSGTSKEHWVGVPVTGGRKVFVSIQEVSGEI